MLSNWRAIAMAYSRSFRLLTLRKVSRANATGAVIWINRGCIDELVLDGFLEMLPGRALQLALTTKGVDAVRACGPH